MKNKFNECFDNLELSKESINEIRNNIVIDYYKHIKRKKITVSIISVFMIILVGLGTVYAKEIGDFINDIKYKIVDTKYRDLKKVYMDETTYKEFNVDSKIKEHRIVNNDFSNYYEIDNNYMTIEEIEKELDIKLLKNSKLDFTKFYPTTVLHEDNKISRIWFEVPEFDLIKPTKVKNGVANYSNGHGRVNFGFNLKSKYYKDTRTEEEKKVPNGYVDELNTVDKYYVKSINTNVVIFTTKFSSSRYYRAEWNYDNIAYYFTIHVNGKFNDQNPNYIYEVLDSFSY